MLPLAEFAPISADFQLNVWNVMLFLSSLATLWAAIRRKPTLDSHLSKFESAIDTLRRSVDELTEAQRASADHDARIRQLEITAGDLRRSHDSCSLSHRADQQRVTREWFDRIEKVENGMSKNFQTMEGAIGRIEGQLAILVADR